MIILHRRATSRGRTRRIFAAALLASGAIAALVQPLSSASAQAVLSFNIGSGSLADALNDFAEQGGVQLVYSSPLVEGRSSPGLVGSFGPAEALSRLLTGSGLTFRQTGPNAFTLEVAPQSAAGAIQLGPVRVEGDGANAAMTARTVAGTAPTENTRSFTSAGPVSAATGLELTLRETPQSITIITRERLDQQAITTLGDALAQAPGVFYQAAGSPVGGYGSLYSRGYTINSLMLDGVPVPPAAVAGYGAIQGLGTLNTDVFDSITVVRGATGLMTGAGDPSATVALTRKRPTDVSQVLALASYGTWDQIHLMGDVGGPLNAAGTVRARTVGAFEDGDSWKQGFHYRKYLGYGIVDADLSERTVASVAVDVGGNNGRGGSGPYTGYALADTQGNPTPFGREDNSQADWSRFQDRRWGVTGTVEHDFSDDWKARLIYNHNEIRTKQDFGLAADIPEPNGDLYLHLRSYRITNTVDTVGAKLDGGFDLFGRRNELVVGFNGSWSDEYTPKFHRNFNNLVNIYTWNRQFPEPDFEPLYRFGWHIKTEQIGGYAATRFRPIEGLSILGGARVSYYRTRDLDETGATVDEREYKGEFTPYVGAVLDVTRHLSLYASYTSIFNPQTVRDMNNRILDPETGTNIEAGIKGEWLDGRLNASAAIFQVKKDNLAVEDGTNLTPSGDQAYIAADDTKGFGWELEVSGEPVEGWSIQGGYTRVRTEDSSGARLNAELPEHMVKLYSTWTPASLSRLTLGGGVIYQSEIYSPFMDPAWAGRYAQDGVAIVNLMARYAITDQISLMANVTNLFDAHYRLDVDVHDYGTPRSVLATVRAKF